MPRRCRTSGRLTPAAATWSSTSPLPGRGVGRDASLSCSGPPGAAISTTRITSGMMSVIYAPVPAARLIDLAAPRVNFAPDGRGRLLFQQADTRAPQGRGRLLFHQAAGPANAAR